MWVETVSEGGWRFMVGRRKEDLDAASHRQKKREATILENKVVFVLRSVEPAKRHQLA